MIPTLGVTISLLITAAFLYMSQMPFNGWPWPTPAAIRRYRHRKRLERIAEAEHDIGLHASDYSYTCRDCSDVRRGAQCLCRDCNRQHDKALNR